MVPKIFHNRKTAKTDSNVTDILYKIMEYCYA